MSKIKFVIKRNGVEVPFTPLRITNAIYRSAVSVGGRDKERAEFLSSEVVKCLEEKIEPGYKPNIEEVQDAVEKILIENGHAKVAKAYILYREEAARKRRKAGNDSSRPSEKIPWAKIWSKLDWAVTHDLHTVEALNKRLRNGEVRDVISASEDAYEGDVASAAKLITERAGNLKMVIVTGPSSSGKTTSTIKIEQRLRERGLKFKPINIDHYFFNLEMHPKDEFGDYDFETPQALDLKLINEHLVDLCDGKSVKIPYYDFKTGQRTLNHSDFSLEKGEILLIDSLHGLYPAMTEGIPDEQKFKTYLEPLLQMKDSDGDYIRWTDVRMIRRMLRDSVQRAYNPQQTLEHWHYVRNSELRHIIPYINTTDYIISSAMPYELAIYRHRLLDKFAEWVEIFQGDPLKEDAFTRASRIYNFLKEIDPIEDDSPVPTDSVLREFIGGSIFSY
ncbi:MAG: response regulator SirA [Bacteroidetes bacterium]|nr:response regulator SirA [Bacteroidota bacterium]